jgi:hypothetical protein
LIVNSVASECVDPRRVPAFVSVELVSQFLFYSLTRLTSLPDRFMIWQKFPGAEGMICPKCWICLAIILSLMAPALGLHVAPAAFESQLTQQEAIELHQALLAANIQPPNNVIVIDPKPPRPVTVRIVVLEDHPVELEALGIAVFGDTVTDIDILQLRGDGDFSGPPVIFQFNWGSAVVVEGTPSRSVPMFLPIILKLER